MSKLKGNRKIFKILNSIVMVIISRGFQLSSRFQKIRYIDIIRIYTVLLLLEVVEVLVVHIL